jgi:DNA mismatch repair protein MutS2
MTQKELIQLIKENNLSPFNLYKTLVKPKTESIFKTRDGKSINNKVLNKISTNFTFSDTSNLLNNFPFTQKPEEIKKRQEFFKQIPRNLTNDQLKQLKKPRPTWGPKYGIVAVTDNEETFVELKKLDVPVKYLLNEDDVLDLQNYDIVQAVDVEQFNLVLEQLPQSVFLDAVEDVYLERYLEQLSAWIDNFKILEQIEHQEIQSILQELNPLLTLIGIKKTDNLTREQIEEKLIDINEEISERVKELNISGENLFKILSDNKMPEDLEKIIDSSIKKTNIQSHLFDQGIPVKINEQELENFLKLQDTNEHTNFAEKIKKNSQILKEIPEKLEKLSTQILIYDFISGISKFISNLEIWPQISEELIIQNAKNLFLENPQPISFNLNQQEKCSILTGANSGGKTTLIEHILQIISLFNLGFPIDGTIQIPLFSEVYYFAKNKGSASKGAFETLLTQMAKINPGNKTLILADEIEAVTEPGVAGKIISTTCKYFIQKNCFLIIATHLGYEIKDILPQYSRIDGIEATGLDNNNELIVNHNPILGRLANSTPELIVEKMAKSGEHDYFVFLHNNLKHNNNNNNQNHQK